MNESRTRALRESLVGVKILLQRARIAIAAWFLSPVFIAAAWLDGLDDWAEAIEED